MPQCQRIGFCIPVHLFFCRCNARVVLVVSRLWSQFLGLGAVFHSFGYVVLVVDCTIYVQEIT